VPIFGLLSDSHGCLATTQRAVTVLLEVGAQVLLHLGDVGSLAVIDALVAQGVESRLVFGNTDDDKEKMKKYAQGLGIIVDDPVGRLSLSDQRQLVYTHGDRPQIFTEAVANGVAYFCHGHTHQRADDLRGQTRVINPGALCRASQYSVALLDTDSHLLTYYPIGMDV